MRQEQQAVVMPYLSIAYSQANNSGQEYQQIHVTNQGLGPARIESIRVLENGKVFEGGPFRYFFDKNDTLDFVRADIIAPGRLIAANDRIVTLTLDNIKYRNVIVETFVFPDVLQSFIRTNKEPTAVLEIVYSSVYGDKWVARSDESIPESID